MGVSSLHTKRSGRPSSPHRCAKFFQLLTAETADLNAVSAAVVEVQAEPEPIPGKSGLQVIRAPMVNIYGKMANFIFLICFFLSFFTGKSRRWSVVQD